LRLIWTLALLLAACTADDKTDDLDDTDVIEDPIDTDTDIEDTTNDAPALDAPGDAEAWVGEALPIELGITDDGDYTIAATSSNPAVLDEVGVTATGDTLNLTPHGQGTTTVTVTVTDDAGQSDEAIFELVSWFDRRDWTGNLVLEEYETGQSLAVGSTGEILIAGYYKEPATNAQGRLFGAAGDMSVRTIAAIDDHLALWGKQIRVVDGVGYMGTNSWPDGAEGQMSGISMIDLATDAVTHAERPEWWGFSDSIVGFDATADGMANTTSWGRVARYDIDGTLEFYVHPVNYGKGPVAIQGDHTLFAFTANGNHILETESDGADMYLGALDATGAVDWFVHHTHPGNQVIQHLMTDDSGALYVCGTSTDPIHGEPTVGGADVFFSKYDDAGAHLWTHTLGSETNESCQGMDLGPDGTTYFAIAYNWNSDDWPVPATSEAKFVAMAPDGTQLWVSSIGSGEDLTMGVDVVVSGLDVLALHGSADVGYAIARFDVDGVQQ
jgi:hypothetical protein